MIMTSQGKTYNADDCEIKIEGKVIDLVTNLKFVGIFVDNMLTG